MKTITLTDIKFKEIIINEKDVTISYEILDDEGKGIIQKTINLIREELTTVQKDKVNEIEQFIKSRLETMEGL